MGASDEIALPELASWPRWMEGPIEQYLIHQPEQGDWPWEDHCNGLAGGILAALRAAGVVLVPIGDLRGVMGLARGCSLPLDMNGWRNGLIDRLDAIVEAAVSGSREATDG